jgi:hypothetical protein
MDSKEISPVERHIFREKSRQDTSRGRSCSGPFYGGSSMIGPPFPAYRPTAHPHRLEQSLTSPAPAVSGAALHPVLPRIRRGELRSLGEVETCRGEGGNNFTLHSFLHRSASPSSSAKPRQANAVSSPQPQKTPKNEALKRAGATPLFRLQSAQKDSEVAPARFDCQAPHADG